MRSLEDLLSELQTDYLATLDERLQHVEWLLDQERWEEATSEFHKLKGNGKTYGLDAVSELAAICEKLYGNDCRQARPGQVAIKLLRTSPKTVDWNGTPGQELLKFIRQSA